jgi:MoaA/NifB/PqqE/SkfB family radical SAM enzyme
MKLTDILTLHVELSSKCNAWCPGCPRNLNGYGLRSGVDPTNLDLSKLNYAVDKLPNLNRVQLCGRFGDPLMHNQFDQVIDDLTTKSYHLQIHTNGSLRNATWWKTLGNKLSNYSHEIWFGLDGLEDTHSLYRQATDFNKVIENAREFIAAGGNAIWQFIPFKHNEHQIRDCIKLAKKIGFKKFEIIEGVRNPITAKHYITGQEYDLIPWSKNSELNYREYTPKFLKIVLTLKHLDYILLHRENIHFVVTSILCTLNIKVFYLILLKKQYHWI